MKKLFSSILPALLLTSCSVQNSFLKRKYTGGIYTEFASKKSDIQKRVVVNKKITPLQTVDEMIDNTSTPNIATNEMNANLIALSEKNIVAASPSKMKNINRTPKISHPTHHHIETTAFKSIHHSNTLLSEYQQFLSLPAFKNNNSEKLTIMHNSDEDTVIQIILALFPILCLIAVYLHDGKNITGNFWVTLLLHLLFVFPAIVFAILVVLNVIDIK